MKPTPYEKSIIILPVKTLPITIFCKIFGYSLAQINRRLERGVWQENVHVLKVEGCKERMVDLEEVDKWARKNKCHVA
ncbi:excisionase [Avibacterium sp. 20-15]|uniref:excisionase n=1 Tax=unclassified Avibacterium TaxID=2685287 RepID=UPI002026600D|nr:MULTISPECIES: excisionase [unclassified Avibacterium]MCW9731966.1 excisionase [Avibacterium sp. 20-15]URL04155.1 excisionase [Avibacterium sp. 20-132]